MCKVIVAGQDVTSRFWPLLKEINIHDQDGLSTDSCRMSLADDDGHIFFPQAGDDVEAHLGTVEGGVGLVFVGFVDEVRSRGSKGGGRELVLTAKGVDNYSQAKEPATRSRDTSSFEEVAQEWGRKHGISSVLVHPDLASIQRAYWSMQGESFINWGQRIARELGATFKIQGGRAMFVPTGEGQSASGRDLPTVVAEWGVNLIDWDIAPIIARTRAAETASRHYDPKSGKWKTVGIELSNEKKAKARITNRFPQANEENAKTRAEADKARVERNGGEGSCSILGTPDAKPEGTCTVVGARPGIDGDYRIEGVTHRFSKRGYTTLLNLKQPQGDAGSDTRGSNGASGSPTYASTAKTSTGRAAGPV